MRSVLTPALTVFLLAATSSAKDIPSAPSSVARPNDGPTVTTTRESSSKTPNLKTTMRATLDRRFLFLSVISTGSAFADTYTTLFAQQNWLAGKKGVCNVEVQSAYLYGTHPTVGRAYGVATAKSVGSVAASYYLHRHHSKFWSLPLLANSIFSLQGTSQNLVACN